MGSSIGIPGNQLGVGGAMLLVILLQQVKKPIIRSSCFGKKHMSTII